jgi:hypothetical protein
LEKPEVDQERRNGTYLGELSEVRGKDEDVGRGFELEEVEVGEVEVDICRGFRWYRVHRVEAA